MLSDTLVSAIMPTRKRCSWALQALDMFLEQTYPLCELVIVDDQMEPSFPNWATIEASIAKGRVQYWREPRLTVGGKRNLAISRAKGQIIMHWDSDDIYTKDRMTHQVRALCEGNYDLVGYNTMEFVDEERRQRWLYNGIPGYCIGVSLTFWRDIWEELPFTNVDKGEDSSFFYGHANRRSKAVDAGGRIVARIHSGNTCDKREDIPKDPMRWQQIPY